MAAQPLSPLRPLPPLQFDLTVLQATNGQEGLQLYLQHRVSICCIFLDLMMPVLDGWSTALKIRRIEEDNEWHPAPIIAYTSEDVPQGSPNWQRCIQSGMNDVVVSPPYESAQRWPTPARSSPVDRPGPRVLSLHLMAT